MIFCSHHVSCSSSHFLFRNYSIYVKCECFCSLQKDEETKKKTLTKERKWKKTLPSHIYCIRIRFYKHFLAYFQLFHRLIKKISSALKQTHRNTKKRQAEKKKHQLATWRFWRGTHNAHFKKFICRFVLLFAFCIFFCFVFIFGYIKQLFAVEL